MGLREDMIDLLEPSVVSLGYELADLEYNIGRRSGLLRLYIDREGGVTLDDCERVSKQIGAVLDVEDPIPGHYTLEVSSPGLDRTLRTRQHFERFAGQRIRVQLKTGLEGRRKFTGTLLGLEKDQVVMQVDAEAVRLPLDDIRRARLVPAW